MERNSKVIACKHFRTTENDGEVRIQHGQTEKSKNTRSEPARFENLNREDYGKKNLVKTWRYIMLYFLLYTCYYVL